MPDSEIRISRKPRNGEEDAVIIAQRFLNIFRQLHIFSDEKKANFNEMLLAQPLDVRAALRGLPAGGLLLDYIGELENTDGSSPAAPTVSAISSEMAEDEVSKAKILATALAEAQIQASAKMQQMNPQPAVTATAAPPPAAPAAPAKIEIGTDFAKELAGALAGALGSNTTAPKDDLKEMVQTIGQSQLEIAKVLKEDNEERRESNAALGKMLAESQTQITRLLAQNNTQPANGESDGEMSQLLKILAKSQMLIAQSLAQQKNSETPAAQPVQTATPAAANDSLYNEESGQLLKMLAASQQHIAQTLQNIEQRSVSNDNKDILNVLENTQQQFAQALTVIQESHRNDTLEITKAMTRSQQELAQMLVQYNTQNNTLNRTESANSNNNANNIQINTTDYSAQLSLIADKLSAVQSFNTQALEEVMTQTVKAQSQLYRETAAAQTQELSSIITLALKESQQASAENIIKAIQEMPKAAVVEKVVTIPQYVTVPQTAAEPMAAADPAVETAADDNVGETESAADEETTAATVFLPEEISAAFQPEEIPATDPTEELPAEELRQEVLASETADEMLYESEASAETVTKKKKRKKKKKNRTAEEAEPTATTVQPLAELSAETVYDKENLFDNNELPPQTDETMDFDLPVSEQTDDDFLFSTESSTAEDLSIYNAETTEYAEDSFVREAPEESVLASESATPINEEKAAGSVADEEPAINFWSAPVEDELPDDSFGNIEGPTAPVGSSWAFDELEDDNGIEPINLDEVQEPLSAAGAAEETEESPAMQDEAQDWEWEYEEVPAEENGDEEWQWEYEETGEPAAVETADNQEWEWDYEEVPVEEVSLSPASQEQIFAQENLAPIGAMNPIKSGDLFFQKEVYKGPEPTLTALGIPGNNFHITIKDSLKTETNDDPYQNSDTKD